MRFIQAEVHVLITPCAPSSQQEKALILSKIISDERCRFSVVFIMDHIGIIREFAVNYIIKAKFAGQDIAILI